MARVLEFIRGIHAVEEEIREHGLEGEAKLDYRSHHAQPLVDAFFGWCHEQRQRMDLVNSAPLASRRAVAFWPTLMPENGERASSFHPDRCW